MIFFFLAYSCCAGFAFPFTKGAALNSMKKELFGTETEYGLQSGLGYLQQKHHIYSYWSYDGLEKMFRQAGLDTRELEEVFPKSQFPEFKENAVRIQNGKIRKIDNAVKDLWNNIEKSDLNRNQLINLKTQVVKIKEMLFQVFGLLDVVDSELGIQYRANKANSDIRILNEIVEQINDGTLSLEEASEYKYGNFRMDYEWYDNSQQKICSAWKILKEKNGLSELSAAVKGLDKLEFDGRILKSELKLAVVHREIYQMLDTILSEITKLSSNTIS